MKILVLYGGASSERNVSLASGDAVAKWCAALGHQVLKYDPERPGEVYAPDQPRAPSAIGVDAPDLKATNHFDPRVARALLHTLEQHEIELAFPILHGGYGEDGTLQALLEWVGMPYTGSGPRSCAVAMHKPTAKALMLQAGIPLARGFDVGSAELPDPAALARRIESEFGFPAIMKPQSGGSTVGLTVLNSCDDVPQAAELIREQRDDALVEEFFSGKEIAATVVDGVGLPLVEIRPKEGIYDYANKYTSGRTEYICPAELPDSITRAVRVAAEQVFAALSARGFARVDFLVNEDKFICLELNSLPGMTALSLVPKAAKAYGWSPEELIERIIKSAWSPDQAANA